MEQPYRSPTPEEAVGQYGDLVYRLAYAKLGSRVMYDIEDLEDWFASRCVHTRDSAPQLRKR